MDSGSVWQGRRVRLRAVEPSDGEAHFAWNHDSEMARQVDRVWFPQSRAATDRWAEQTALAEAQGDNFVFEIESLSGEHVGIIDTHSCNPRNGTFAYGVVIHAEHKRQGYASDAIRVVLRHYFEELRYQKVTVRVYSFNDASIQLHERLGFQREGRLRRMVYTQGQFFDEIVFGLTSDEFAARPAG